MSVHAGARRTQVVAWFADTFSKEHHVIRGMYTGASGMASQQHRLDAIANNLANADTSAYKTDEAVFKAFPELLLRRMNTNITSLPPSEKNPLLGSVDRAPVVGKIGTGVELNELHTNFTQGSMKISNNPFDLALEGQGFFTVLTPYGERLTRNGSFLLGPEGMVVTKEGYPLLGEEGPLEIKGSKMNINEGGSVFVAQRGGEENWQQIDNLKIVSVDELRYLKKQGSSLYLETDESGAAASLTGEERPKVRQGMLETSNVNPIQEMVKMISVNRAYEANQKVIQSEDQATEKLLNQVFRI